MRSFDLDRIWERRDILILIAISFAALSVRMYGINFALPQWDEFGTFNEAFFALNKQLDVPAYEHGSLLAYLVLLIWYPFGVLLSRSLPSAYTLLVMYYQNPIAFAVLARMLSVLASTATVVATYLCARQLYDQVVGLLSAFFIAFTFLHVSESHYIRSYALVTFFAVLAVFFCARLLRDNRLRNYFFAGIFSGLATAAQYSGFLLILPLFVAHAYGVRRSSRFSEWLKDALVSKPLLVALDAAGLAFFMTTPYALLDFSVYSATIKEFVLHGQRVMPVLSSEGQPIWLFYLTEHLAGGMGKGLEIVALVGLSYLLFRHRNQDVTLIAFPLILLITLNESVDFARYAVPLLPFLAISAANLITDLVSVIARRFPLRLISSLSVILATLLISPSLQNILRFDFWITQPDTRLFAAKWIEANVPAGTRIVVEGAGILGPPLSENKEMLGERIANEPAGSLEELNAGALLATLPATSTYSVTVVYRIDQRYDRGALVGFVPSAHAYADVGVDYLVTVNWMMRTEQETYSPVFQESLDALYDRVAEIRPTIVFRWDPYAWRVDYDALSQIVPGNAQVGGPILTIYRRIESK